MTTAAALRLQIEAALAHRIPSALSPAPRLIRPVSPTGIASVDALLEGGLPLGAITEVAGPECSGRTSLALSFVAQMTQGGKVCAWVDVSNGLDPESAAAIGVDLPSLLWVRCGVAAATAADPPPRGNFRLGDEYFIPPPGIKGLHGGGHGPHPRAEAKGLSDAVGGFLRPEQMAGNRAEEGGGSNPRRQPAESSREATPEQSSAPGQASADVGNGLFSSCKPPSRPFARRPFARIDQALRVTDLLLQAGGFGAIVLDMAGIAPEDALRVPLATWFRYRAAAERTQAAILLLTQHPCAKSSAALLLQLKAGRPLAEEPTLFTGLEHRVEIARERFQPDLVEPVRRNVLPMRKPPQGVRGTSWESWTSWASGTGGR